jgi:DNA-nicking Smr family endonuclease
MSRRDEPGKPKGERFADFLDEETRPLERGPTRVAPPAPPRPRVDPGHDASDSPSGFHRPDPAEPLLGARSGVTDATLYALRRGDPTPQERVDLHGTRTDTAAALLTKRLESARARGLRCVAVIHGRGKHSATGEAVLRDALPEWLTSPPSANHVLAFAPAPSSLGGIGATLVLLRKKR